MDGELNQNATLQEKAKPIPKPQPGRFPIKQRIAMEPTAGHSGKFTHDEEVVGNFSRALADRFHGYENGFNNDPMPLDDFTEATYRFVSAGMAKKLAVSLSKEQRLSHETKLSALGKAQLSGPPAVGMFIDFFGSVAHEKNEYEMIGQPALAFAYLYRAVEDVVPNRGRALALNLAWRSSTQDLIEYCSGVIRAWALTAPPHEFTFPGDVRVQMSIPVPNRNYAGYAVFVEHVPKNPQVIRCIRIASILENANGAVPQNVIAALNAQGVAVVDWNREMIDTLWTQYARAVESRIRIAYAAGSGWTHYNAFKNFGNPGQILSRTTEEMIKGPLQLGGGEMDVGWTLAGRGTIAVPDLGAFYLVPPRSVTAGHYEYVDRMLKKI